jgi:outer membrane protein TolC
MTPTSNVLPTTLALLVIAASARVRAEEVTRLEPLVREAIQHHPTVRSAERMAAAAAEVVSREGALPDPMVSVGPQNFVVSNPQLSADPMSNVQVMITQELPFPGKRSRRAAVASANAETSRSDARVTTIAVSLRVRQAYWRLHLAEQTEQITRESVDILEHLLQITRVRFSVGQAAQQDVFQAEVARSRALAMLEERAQMIRTGRRELNSAVGRPPESALGPTEAAPEKVALDRLAITSAASRMNPDVLAARARTAAAARMVDEASYDRWPDLQVSGGYMVRAPVPGDAMSGSDMFSANVGVTLPLWMARKQNARVREARESLAAAEAAVDASALTAMTAVQSALDVVERLTRELALFESDVEPKAEQAVASGTAEYQVGKTTFVAVLQSWQALLDAQLDIARLRSERAQAIADIQALVGGAGP